VDSEWTKGEIVLLYLCIDDNFWELLEYYYERDLSDNRGNVEYMENL